MAESHPRSGLTIWSEGWSGSAFAGTAMHLIMVGSINLLNFVVRTLLYPSWCGIYQRSDQVHGRFTHSLRIRYLGCHMVQRKRSWRLITCKDKGSMVIVILERTYLSKRK